MGLSKRQVQVYLKRLVEKGFVTIIYRNNTLETDCRSSIYVLNILPGLSEADRKRIASTRTIGIKNKISGLNIIKVQTSKGMMYTSQEEFDLEYLVTGKRSSCVIEGEIGEVEIDKENTAEVEIDKENTVEEFDGLKITTGRKVVDPESLKRNNSVDPDTIATIP